MDRRRGNVLSMVMKYWSHVLFRDSVEILGTCCEWQVNNLKIEGLAKKLKERLEIRSLAYIFQS
jgi:hypothetical protein